jgi:hypothetical protein
VIDSIEEFLQVEINAPAFRDNGEDVDQLHFTFLKLLRQISVAGKQVMIVVDSADHLGDSAETGLKWLPIALPMGVGIVVSLADEAHRPRLIAGRESLASVSLEGLGGSLPSQLVNTRLASYGKQLSSGQLEHLLGKSDAFLPLYLVTVTEELRIFAEFPTGSRFGVDHVIQTHIANLPGTLLALTVKLFGLLENGHKDLPVRLLLCALACSRRGLLETELLAAVSTEDEISSGMWAPLRRRLHFLFSTESHT